MMFKLLPTNIALFLTLGLATGNNDDASPVVVVNPASWSSVIPANLRSVSMLHSGTTKSGGDFSGNDDTSKNKAVGIAPTGKARGKITIQHVLQNAQDFNGIAVMEALQEAYSNVYNADYNIAWYTIESEQFTPENGTNTLSSRLFAPVLAPVHYQYAQYYYYGWDCHLCPNDDDLFMTDILVVDPVKLITAETLLCNRLRFSGNSAFRDAANCKIEPIRDNGDEDEDKEEEEVLTEKNEENAVDDSAFDDPANIKEGGEFVEEKN